MDRTRRRILIAVVSLVVVLIGGAFAYAHFRATRMTIAEFEEFVEGPEAHGATMWKGLDYCGHKDGWAYFCNHLAWQKRYIAIPVERTKGFPPLEYMFSSSKWIKASHGEFRDGVFEYQP